MPIIFLVYSETNWLHFGIIENTKSKTEAFEHAMITRFDICIPENPSWKLRRDVIVMDGQIADLQAQRYSVAFAPCLEAAG